MSMINCPECNKEISDKAKVCPNCGYVLKGHKKKIGKALIIIGIHLFIIDLIYEMINHQKNFELKVYAISHNDYYPFSYYVARFFTSAVYLGSIVLVIIGIILYIKNKKNNL